MKKCHLNLSPYLRKNKNRMRRDFLYVLQSLMENISNKPNNLLPIGNWHDSYQLLPFIEVNLMKITIQCSDNQFFVYCFVFFGFLVTFSGNGQLFPSWNRKDIFKNLTKTKINILYVSGISRFSRFIPFTLNRKLACAM